jgi:hypothetical protein
MACAELDHESALGDAGLLHFGEEAPSDRSAHRIDDFESGEVLFVIRYHNTLVRPCAQDDFSISE